MRTITTHYINNMFAEFHGKQVMDIIGPSTEKVIANLRDQWCCFSRATIFEQGADPDEKHGNQKDRSTVAVSIPPTAPVPMARRVSSSSPKVALGKVRCDRSDAFRLADYQSSVLASLQCGNVAKRLFRQY